MTRMQGPQGDADLLVVLLRKWRRIAVLTAVGVGLGLLYGFLAPAWYEAHLRVVPSVRDAGPAELLAQSIPSLGALTGGSSPDSQRIEAVLRSSSVTDAVIEKFQLQAYYGNDYIEQTREALWKHCNTDVNLMSGVVSLTCEDKDPKRAKEMAAYFGTVGNEVFGRISTSSAREERKFLEEQLKSARDEVDEASSKLRDFQEKHKIIDLPEQSKAVISAMASIKGDLLSKQLELKYLRSFSSPTESNVTQLQKHIALMQRQLDDMEAARPGKTPPADSASKNNADFFPGALSVPELRFVLEQLYRDQKTKETVLLLMTQRYEMAKVDEARDTSSFQILDQPKLPTYRSRPHRLRIAFLGMLAGIAIACAWILTPVWWRRRLEGQAIG